MQKETIDQTGDVLRYEGLRISFAEQQYLQRLGKKISRWLPEEKQITVFCYDGEWIYRKFKITDVVDNQEE